MHEPLYRARTWLASTLQQALTRTGPLAHGGIALEIAPGVHHPAPVLGIGVLALQRAALDRLPARARVLELGTGAGFWATDAARRGHEVTATDLPHVPLEPVARAAERAGMHVRLVHSDLFAALAGERFDAILFNPPFHDAAPRSADETAWCGGEVVRRCLREASAHLAPGGTVYLVMPRLDRARYDDALAPWSLAIAASRWYPLLGRTELLALAPPAISDPSTSARASRRTP